MGITQNSSMSNIPVSYTHLDVYKRQVEEVKKLREKDERIHLVSFSRNFGKEAAIIAGLEKAKGDFTVLMDADLQDPPALLPEMYGYIEKGYDCLLYTSISQFSWSAIRHCCIPYNLSGIAYCSLYGLSQFLNSHFFTGTDIDMLLSAVVFQKEYAGIRHIIYIEELTKRRTCSPEFNAWCIVYFGFMELTDHCRHNMGCLLYTSPLS